MIDFSFYHHYLKALIGATLLFNPVVFTLHANLLCFTPVRAIYAISYLFMFSFTPPPTLAAPSDSRRSCKMKATALLHVTIPTLPFLFHWPQTPDFSEAKNRPLQTLTPPPHSPSTLSLFCSWYTGFQWEVSLCYAHSSLPCARQSPASTFTVVSLCGRETSESFML